MRTPFNERATEMGLEYNAAKLMASYSDQFGEVVYRQLTTMPGMEAHPTDAQVAPIQAIYTRPSDNPEAEFKYCGYVSDIYQFIGNEVLNQSIRQAISQVGLPIVRESVVRSDNLTRMRNEIIIESSQSVPHVGDVLPVMIVENSYDGSKAAVVTFGITTRVNNERVVFAFGLGSMRQVHIVNASTQMASAISEYMEVFSSDIANMVSGSFQSTISEEQMLGTLDLIEKIGKKRREEVSKFLADMNPPAVEGQEPPLPSAWQMFLAIVRYSSLEENLNAKRLMENAAESVLVIPQRMFQVLDRLQSQ